MAEVASFQITVPRKTAVGQLPIAKMKLLVDVASESAVTFRVTDPRGPAIQNSFGPFTPGSASSALTAFNPTPPGAVAPNSLTVVPPTTVAPSGDPSRRRYVFFFNLDADYDPNNSCANTMAADQTWTLEVTAGPLIIGGCAQCFDRNIPGQQCIGPIEPVQVGAVAAIDGTAIQACELLRPGLDAVLVLDKSGSMAGSTMGNVAQAKIDALHKAVTDFVNRWNGIRTAEASGDPSTGVKPTVNTDNIGVTLFDSSAAWWSALSPSLNSFPSVQATILAQVNSIPPGGATSIGGGLLLADSVLNVMDTTRRRVVLLMSNGMQNTDPMVGVANGQVVTYSQNTPNVQTPLPNQSKYQIYAVTVGTSTAVSAQINQDVANTTKGFYINTEDDAAQMSPFFLELLQNFVKFNSWETARLIHATVTRTTPYTTTIPFATTTQKVAFSLRWPDFVGALRLSVTPPGETTPTEQVGVGAVNLNFSVPTSANYTFTGDWQVRVEAADVVGIEATAVNVAGAIPFDLTVLCDDAALHADTAIVPADYVPGQAIQFTARVTTFGQPVSDLGTHSGDRVVVQVVKPGVGVGDLLSTSNASTAQPYPTDPSTNADAKLTNQLQQSPASLVRDSNDVITLVDSGNGVYRGSYTVQNPGHYNFLFGIEGPTRDVGRFSRQQLETVYVRPAPSGTTTAFQTSIQSLTNGLQLSITMTPRTGLGARLGPGWANYFWFTVPGRTAVKARDNLDGTYAVQVPFNGILPPQVAVHFLNVSLVIGDAVTPDNLPVPLGDNNVIVPVVNPLPLPIPLPSSPWQLLLLLLFLLWLIIQIIRRLF